MIRVTVVCVGKLKESYLRDAVKEYEKRLGRYCRLEIRELAERATLAEEGDAILAALSGRTVVLTPEGKSRTSEGFSDLLGRSVDRGEAVTFVIGSSCGLDPRVKARADELLSFSQLTFPHQLFRVMLLEQIYRGFTILAGTPYHK